MAVARVVCPAFIGRESELSVLEDSLLSAIRGEGGVVVLGGEAGMGKSRLVRELANRAERLGCVVMSGACSDAELSLPYLPFLEAIGNYLTRQDVTAMRERLGPAAAELGQLFHARLRGAGSEVTARKQRRRLVQAVEPGEDPAREQHCAGDRCNRCDAREHEDLHVVVHVEHDETRREHRAQRQDRSQDGNRDELQAQRRQQPQDEGGADADGEAHGAEQDDGLDHGAGMNR